MVKDQHEKIKGYRDLSEQEIALMNEGKELAVQVGAWIEKLESMERFEVDHRWVAIGKTHLQQGFMAAIRGIARPETF